MYRNMLRGKLHRATVTGADLDYEGSATIDSALMELSDIVPNQEIEVWNITNGKRFRTYALEGQPDSGVICINGAAAHMVSKGDLVIIATFGWMTDEEARDFRPKLVFLDAHNRPKELDRAENAGQADVQEVVWQ